MFAREIFGLD